MAKPYIITYQSENGCSGKLRPWFRDGKLVYALYIYDRAGDLVLHAGTTPAQNLEDLKELVEEFPVFQELLNGIEEEDDGLCNDTL